MMTDQTTDHEDATQNRRWMTLRDAMDYLHIKDPRYLKKIATAAGAAAKFGKRIYIDKWKLDAFMTQQMEQQTQIQTHER